MGGVSNYLILWMLILFLRVHFVVVEVEPPKWRQRRRDYYPKMKIHPFPHHVGVGVDYLLLGVMVV